MAVNGTFPLQSLPLLPIAQAATQVQISGDSGYANRTITTPADGLSLSFDAISVKINPSMMGIEDLLSALLNAGVAVILSYGGRLILPNTTAVTGNATLKTALGLP